MSQSASHHPPIPLKRLDYTLPPKVDGKKWVVHRRQAKLIQPRNAGAFPALSGGNKAIGSDVSLFHRSPRPQVSKESGELTFLLMPSVPSDYEHTRPVHFICTSAISQKELDDKIKDPGYDHDADELITIQIICSETNAYHKYYEQREVLVRSPVLAKFFSSIHFQPHAQTTMIFTQYPTMILQTVLMHLLHGSNAVEALRAALMKFKIKERICRYIELITLAKKFTMYQLNIDVIDLLRANLTADVKPEHCIMLVEMLYLPNPVRDIMIKAWANQCITNNLDALWKIPRFVHLAKTSWLKFEVDSFPTYEVCPWEAQDKKVEEAKKGEGEEEQPWVAGAAPGSQLGASPPPKKKGKWWKKGGGGAPAAVGAGAGVVAAPAAAGGAVGGAAAAAAGGPAGESAGGAGGGSAGGAAGGLAGGAAGGLAGVAAAGPAVGSAGGAVGAAVGGAAGGAAGKKKGLVARLFCH